MVNYINFRCRVNEFVKSAKGYINLLNQHIEKENGVLFPLAEKHLLKQAQQKLWEGFEMIETQKLAGDSKKLEGRRNRK